MNSIDLIEQAAQEIRGKSDGLTDRAMNDQFKGRPQAEMPLDEVITIYEGFLLALEEIKDQVQAEDSGENYNDDEL
jgi:hypothetical protein